MRASRFVPELSAAVILLVLVGGARAAEPAAPALTPGLEWQITLLTDNVLPGEPVILRMTLRNTSARPAEFRDSRPLRLTVQKVSDPASAARQLWLMRKAPPKEPPPVSLGPGKEHNRKVLMVLGGTPDADASAGQFILPEPGKYRIIFDGVPGQIEVTVVEPASAEDKAARDLWTPKEAFGLVSEMRYVESRRPVDKICSLYVTSRYAPYALWMRADELAQGGGHLAWIQASVLAEILLDRYRGFALREEVFKALVNLYAVMNERQRARETAEEFAREFPASEHLVGLRQSYGDGFEQLGPRWPMPPSGAQVVKPTVAVSGTEAIPAAVRPVFETFWKAVGEGSFAALPNLCTRDFMSDYGPRGAYASALWQHRRAATAGAIQVAVRKARMAMSYARPSSLPAGAARTWYGPLCIVEGSLLIQWTIGGVAGGEGNTLDAPQACWVFYGYPDGSWKLLSETAQSRNYYVGARGKDLMNALPRMFTTWRVSDGARMRLPFEEIKSHLGLTGKTIDEQAEWTSHRLNMTGPGRTYGLIVGHVRIPVKDAAAVERDIELLIGVDSNEGLILKGLRVVPPGTLPSTAWAGEPPRPVPPSPGPLIPGR